jgi:predicted nuclease of predicted toxin-antitoxin system
MSRASDIDLLKKAGADERIFVTRDKDFGGLVFVGNFGKGVILLRIRPSTMNQAHDELKNLLDRYTETELKTAFVVVEAGVHRYRRLLP